MNWNLASCRKQNDDNPQASTVKVYLTFGLGAALPASGNVTDKIMVYHPIMEAELRNELGLVVGVATLHNQSFQLSFAYQIK